jgi:hypothetical protein
MVVPVEFDVAAHLHNNGGEQWAIQCIRNRDGYLGGTLFVEHIPVATLARLGQHMDIFLFTCRQYQVIAKMGCSLLSLIHSFVNIGRS